MNLRDILQRFPDQEACIAFLETLRWGNTPRCLKGEVRYQTQGRKRFGAGRTLVLHGLRGIIQSHQRNDLSEYQD